MKKIFGATPKSLRHFCYNGNMNELTIFEKIIAGEIPVDFIYEDEQVVAFLDAFPFEKGHILVIPRHPYVSVWEMSESEYVHLQSVVHKLACRLQEQYDTPISIYQRNLPGAGQEVPHVHVHIVPRFTTEHERPIFNDVGEQRISYDSEEEKQSFVEKLTLR